MAIERGKSFSIAVISCSISRSARSEVSTNCVCPSRHEMHSQYEPCSFELCMFCVSRSNCFKSVILTFSSPSHYHEPEIIPVTLSAAKRSEEHTSELQSPDHLVCRLLLE